MLFQWFFQHIDSSYWDFVPVKYFMADSNNGMLSLKLPRARLHSWHRNPLYSPVVWLWSKHQAPLLPPPLPSTSDSSLLQIGHTWPIGGVNNRNLCLCCLCTVSQLLHFARRCLAPLLKLNKPMGNIFKHWLQVLVCCSVSPNNSSNKLCMLLSITGSTELVNQTQWD